MLYFDHNATHPVSPAARAAWLDAVERLPANPSSPHRLGARADAALADARISLARWIQCDPGRIVWTSGASEANNTVLRHLALATRGPVLLSPVEHPSVRAAAQLWLGPRVEAMPIPRHGRVDGDWINDRLLRGDVGGVVLMAANNETGVLQPWDAVAALCAAAGVPFFCDAAQWVGRMPAAGLGACTFVTACGHKFGGPRGTGFIVACPELEPLVVGGPQEEGRRAGTEDVAGVLALVAALREREEALNPTGTRPGPGLAERSAWRDSFIGSLRQALPDTEVVGAEAPRLWNTAAVLLPQTADCRRRWVVKLDRLGVAASTGSACSSGREKPSHVLAAMGYQPDESDRMVRFSAGWDTRPEDWAALFDAVRRAATELLGGGTEAAHGAGPQACPLPRVAFCGTGTGL